MLRSNRAVRADSTFGARPKPHGKISASKNISTLDAALLVVEHSQTVNTIPCEDYVSKHKSFVPGPTYVPPPWPLGFVWVLECTTVTNLALSQAGAVSVSASPS